MQGNSYYRLGAFRNKFLLFLLVVGIIILLSEPILSLAQSNGDPGPGNSNGNAYGVGNGNANGNAYGVGNGNANGNAYGVGNGNANGNANNNDTTDNTSNLNGNGNANGSGNAISDAGTDTVIFVPDADGKITICHVGGRASDPSNYVTLTLPLQAVHGHFDENGTPLAGHEEDWMGACDRESVMDNVEEASVTGFLNTFVEGGDNSSVTTTNKTPSTNNTNPIENTATTDTGDEVNPSETYNGTVSIFDPSLSKIGYLPAGGLGLVGEDLIWEVTVTNDSAATETNIVVTDVIRSELQINGVTFSRPATMSQVTNGQQIDVTISTLAPGESVQFFIDTTVISSPVDDGVDNTVTSGSESATAIVPLNRSLCTAGSGSSTDLSITPVHENSRFYIDNDSTPPQSGMYVGYEITNNTGTDIDELYVVLDGFTGTVDLALNEDGESRVGFLGAGDTTTVYFYLAVPETLDLNNGDIIAPQDFLVNAYEGEPSGTGQICSYEDGFAMIDDTIRANANQIETVTGGVFPPVLGGEFNINITGNTGNVGNFEDCLFQTTPATYFDWDADAFELVSIEVIFYDYPNVGDVTTFTNLLSIENVCGAAAAYEVIYTFHVEDIPDGGTEVSPSNNVASGNQIKHQDPEEDPNGGAPFIPVPINNAVITKTVDPAVLVLGGTATYSIDLTNAGAAGTTSITLHEVFDVMPSTPDIVTYVPGSSTLGGVAIGDPTIDGQNLEWDLFVEIPADSTITLTYDANIPATPGIYTNTATGGINSIQIDTTIPTDDDAPATADVLVLAPDVEVEKTATTTTINEPDADVTFDIVVSNTGTVDLTLSALTDDIYGDITQVQGAISATTCSVTQTIPVNGTYTCSFTAFVTGNAGDVHTNTVTANAEGGGAPTSDTDEAVVTILDVVPTILVDKSPNPSSVPETGGDVVFSVQVTNTSVEPVTLTNLVDNLYGDITIVQASITATTCSIPQTLVVNGIYTCDFTVILSGNVSDTHTNIVTGTANDDENNTTTDSDDAVVSFTDVLPAITVVKTANPTSVPETGGDVTFTVQVTNDSDEELTLTILNDSIYGDLAVPVGFLSTCSVPQTIAVGGDYTCEFMVTLTGNTTDTHNNVMTATANDDEGNDATNDDDATVTFTDVLPAITVVKTANPTSVPETGGDITFTVTVTNDSDEEITLTSLDDSVYGDLTGVADTTCTLSQSIAVGGDYSCQFTVTLNGNAGEQHENIVTATANDDENNEVTDDDNATVDFTDVIPEISVTKTPDVNSVPETGGDVTFTVLVSNTGIEDVTLDQLLDSLYGDITVVQGDVTATTCAVPQTITVSDNYSCTFTATVVGNAVDATPHQNTVTATAFDDDGNDVTDDDTATVNITDVLPEIIVSKDASVSVVPETGGDVTFTIVVENTGPEVVTLDTLTDDVFGDVGTWVDTTCSVPQTIAVNGDYTCTFTEFLEGNTTDLHNNTVTATGNDDDGNETTATDSATVGFTDVLPAITVLKTPSVDSVPETGGDVTFTVQVFNDSGEALTLLVLTDDVYGDLTTASGTSCILPQTIAVGGSYTCSFTGTLTGNTVDATPHQNTATAIAIDDEDNPVTDTDDAVVSLTDVLPAITVEKTPSADSVPETGGDVFFTVEVFNDSDEELTLHTLNDSVYGDLTTIADTTCATPQTLVVGGSYTCMFLVNLTGNTVDATPHENTVTATASDDEGNDATNNDDAVVSFTDVLPAIIVTKTPDPSSVPETGGDVTFTVEVINDSEEILALTSLTDDVYGDLTAAPDTTCILPQTLAIGGSYACTFTDTLSGNTVDATPHQNIVTATANDDEGNDATATDDAVVSFTDVLPDITVDKLAGSASVPQTGENVVFTVEVTNRGLEDFTLTALTDNLFGDITQVQGLVSVTDCAVPQNLASGASYTCSFTALVSGTPESNHINVVTGTATDDENNDVTDSDDATVAIAELPGVIDITKTTTTPYVSMGGDATFLLEVNNPGPLSITNVNVIDDLCDVFPVINAGFNVGDINQDNILDIGETWQYTCTVTNVTASMVNQATVMGTDENGNDVNDIDSEDFTIIGLRIVKTASETVITSGDNVTFTLRVTNMGDAPMRNVVVTDPLCTPQPVLEAGFNKGDIDTDNALDLAEEWEYTCTMTNVTANVTNIASVTATAPDGTSTDDTDSETVTVIDPVDLPVPTDAPDPTQEPEDSDEPGPRIVSEPVEMRSAPVYDLVTRLPSLGAESCRNACIPWVMYHTNQTGDWEIFRTDSNPDADYTAINVSNGEGAKDLAPTRSPDGQWIAFASDRDGNWEIYVSTISGTFLQRVTYNTIAHDTNPVWGANNWIVYESTRSGSWDLFIFDVETGEEAQLTFDEGQDLNPYWSTDGERILFQSNRDGSWQIYEINLLTLEVEAITEGPGEFVDPMYSPDGRRIVFRSYDEELNSQLYMLERHRDNQYTILTDGKGNASQASFSPDGLMLSYQSDRDGDLEVYIYEIATGMTRQVTDNDVPDYAPTWLCDGSSIIYTSEITGNPDIFTADARPMTAPPILTDDWSGLLTDAPEFDIYPLNTPSDEDASREGGLPFIGLDPRLTEFLSPNVSLTEEDVSSVGERWLPVKICSE